MKGRLLQTAAAVALAAILVFALLAAMVPDFGNNTRTYWAGVGARRIASACEEYRRHPGSGGKYPGALSDLIKPPFGGSSCLHGAQDLIDPWGRPFRYAVVKHADGEEVYVWGERAVEGGLRLVGAKLTTDGKVGPLGRSGEHSGAHERPAAALHFAANPSCWGRLRGNVR
jgi:hypothetical protein